MLVLPGGLREAVKPRELRYRLLWGHRYGFVRAALKNRAPVIPLAAVGSEELFELVGDAYARGLRWLHRRFPLPLVRHVRRAHLTFIFGDPIVFDVDPAKCDDPPTLKRARHEIEGALQELIDEELARRAHVAVE